MEWDTKGHRRLIDKPLAHGLGFGHGSLIEHPDGSVEYRQTEKLLPAFRVRVQDVTGFSVRKTTRDDKKRSQTVGWQQALTVQGSGTSLAEVALNYGTAEKIENWFREHRDFGTKPQPQPTGARHHSPSTPTNLVADELMKLSQLRDARVITPAEFRLQV